MQHTLLSIPFLFILSAEEISTQTVPKLFIILIEKTNLQHASHTSYFHTITYTQPVEYKADHLPPLSAEIQCA
jgi:hypothetical protein